MKTKLGLDVFYRLRFIRDFDVFDGNIIYNLEYVKKVENEKDSKKKEYKKFSNLYFIDKKGKIKQFTYGNHTDYSPRFSPDGKFIAFLTNRKEKKANIYLIPTDGGEPFEVFSEKGAIAGFKWAENSKYIYFLYQKDIQEDKIISREIDRLWYKLDGLGFLKKEKYQLYRVDIKTKKHNLIAEEINGISDFTLANKDGSDLFYIANVNKDLEFRLQYDDVFRLKDGKKEKIPLKEGAKSSLTYDKENNILAFIYQDKPDKYHWKISKLYIYDLKSNKSKIYIDDSGRYDLFDSVLDDTGNPSFSPTRLQFLGDDIYLLSTKRGATNLYRFSLKNEKFQQLTDENFRIVKFKAIDKENIALFISTTKDPGQLYILNIKSKNLKKLTKYNNCLNNRYIAEYERFTFKGAKDEEVEGWILKPQGFDKKKKYPLVLQIHGGPTAQYGYSFYYELQLLANEGYVVIFINPHGSTGYGLDFTLSIKDKWGVYDWQDFEKLINDYIMKLDYIDKKNMFVTGGSYGGYMTNWIIGHTDVFKAAITQRCVSNMVSMMLTSDLGFEMAWVFKKKDVIKDYEFYWDMSPIKYIDNVKTPLLIIHSEQDHRCPIEQAEQLYTALKLRKQEVKFIRFPEESHGLSRIGSPERRYKRLKYIIDFFNEKRG